jgi:hypothetical protein
MKLLSLDKPNEMGQSFFKGERNNSGAYETGKHITNIFGIMRLLIICFGCVDLNRIWTSADASCIARSSKAGRKCSGVKWCSTGKVLRKTKPIQVPANMQDLCLTYERQSQRFTYRSCRSRFHFVCEVCQIMFLREFCRFQFFLI